MRHKPIGIPVSKTGAPLYNSTEIFPYFRQIVPKNRVKPMPTKARIEVELVCQFYGDSDLVCALDDLIDEDKAIKTKSGKRLMPIFQNSSCSSKGQTRPTTQPRKNPTQNNQAEQKKLRFPRHFCKRIGRDIGST